MTFVSKAALAAIQEREAHEREMQERRERSRGLDDAAWCRMADEPDRPPPGSEVMWPYFQSYSISEVDWSAFNDAVAASKVTMRELQEAILELASWDPHAALRDVGGAA